MTILDVTNRARVAAQAMRNGLGAAGISKTDLRAAVDATDQWIEDNSAVFNLAIPQPARGALTAPQKTALFCFVAMRRAGLLRAEED